MIKEINKDQLKKLLERKEQKDPIINKLVNKIILAAKENGFPDAESIILKDYVHILLLPNNSEKNR